MKTQANLHDLARTARLRSYSPYSEKKVGAVIELENGERFLGCNVENSSFGGTVCAERVAIFNAVAALGETPNEIRIKKVVVATDASPPWSPCGLCRQVINEFAAKDCQIELVNLKGDVVRHQFFDLFPHGFDRSALISSSESSSSTSDSFKR